MHEQDTQLICYGCNKPIADSSPLNYGPHTGKPYCEECWNDMQRTIKWLRAKSHEPRDLV